jgi:hypothetical protein
MMELNKEVLDCMKALRRRLRDEQAADGNPTGSVRIYRGQRIYA